MKPAKHREDSTDPHKRAVSNYFSKAALYWKVIYDENCDICDINDKVVTLEMQRRKAVVLRNLDAYASGRSLRVLDLGCGTGIYAEELLKRGHKVIGADINEQMALETQQIMDTYDIPGSGCTNNDCEHLPFQDKAFDVIICVGVLMYLKNDELSISEMQRVLKNGGIIILTLPNLLCLNKIMDPYYYYRGFKYLLYKINSGSKRTHDNKEEFGSNTTFKLRKYIFGRIPKLSRKYGLITTKTEGIGFAHLTIWTKRVLPDSIQIKLSDSLERLSAWGFGSMLNIIANRWIICLKKPTT